MRRQGWKSCTVCCVSSLVGRKNTPWLGQHYSSPQTQSMSWSLSVSGKKWQTRRSGRRWSKKHVSPLGPPPSCYIHSLFFTVERKKKKKKSLDMSVCLCACICVWLVIPIRGFVFFLHYLSSLSSEQFYFQPIISCPARGYLELGRRARQTHKLWIHAEAQHYKHMYVFPQK